MADAQRIELEIDPEEGHPVRFLWAHFITPKKSKKFPDKAGYEGIVLIPKEHSITSTIRSKIREALATEFGAAQVPDNFAGYKLPIECGDLFDDAAKATDPQKGGTPFTRGHWVLRVRASDKRPVPLATMINGKGVVLTPDLMVAHSQDFYSGVHGGCKVVFQALREPNRCACWLNGAYSLMRGDAVAGGGGYNPTAKMSGHVGKPSDVDPTARSAGGF